MACLSACTGDAGDPAGDPTGEAPERGDPCADHAPDDAGACVMDLECGLLPVACTADSECAAGEACVRTEAGGRCAFVPDEGVDCASFEAEPVTLTAVEGGASIEVCRDPAPACLAGRCHAGCGDDADCTRPDAPFCNSDSGVCECRTDADCFGPGDLSCMAGACVAQCG